MSSDGYDNTTGAWERLLAAVRENEQLFTAAESHWAALAFYLEEVREAKERQQLHSFERQQATEELNQRLAAGRDAARCLQSLVKSHLGPRSERLPEFGIAPIRKRGSSSRPELVAPPEPEGPEQMK